MTERKLGRGEAFRVSGREHAGWQDAAAIARNQKLGTSELAGDIDDNQDGIILVKNTTGRPLRRFSVLGLRGSLYNANYNPPQSLIDFKNNIAIKGEVPSSVTLGRFCVLQRPAIENEWVEARVSGLTQCLLKVGSITDQFADIETDPGTVATPIDQTAYLKTGSSGSAQIIHHPEVIGEQWGVVRLGNKIADTWKVAAITFDGTGAYNPASSGEEKIMYWNFLTSSEASPPFELTSGANKELRVTRDVNPCFIVGRLNVTVDYVRNSWSQITGNLKREFDDSGSWSSIGLGGDIERLSWPDVATISGGTAYSKTIRLDCGVQLTEGMDLRGSLEVYYGSTSPQVSAGGEINIYYK